MRVKYVKREKDSGIRSYVAICKLLKGNVSAIFSATLRSQK